MGFSARACLRPIGDGAHLSPRLEKTSSSGSGTISAITTGILFRRTGCDLLVACFAAGRFCFFPADRSHGAAFAADHDCSSTSAPWRPAVAAAVRPATAIREPWARAVSSMAIAEEFSSPVDASRRVLDPFHPEQHSLASSRFLRTGTSFAGLA